VRTEKSEARGRADGGLVDVPSVCVLCRTACALCVCRCGSRVRH